jgi:polyferredoxin
MIEARYLTYDYDEERFGIAEPPKVAGPGRSAGEKASVAVIALGLLAMVVLLLGAPGTGTWSGFLFAFAPIALGTASLFWFDYRGTSPGIKHDDNVFSGVKRRGLLGWGLGILLTGFYSVLYWTPNLLERGVRLVDPLAEILTGKPADHWFLYGFLYTLAILLFGVRMFMKYRHNRYQLVRTASVMVFQLGLAFLLPNVMKALNAPEFYFTYFWPLKWTYLWPAGHGIGWILDSGALGVFLIFWGAVMTFVTTPILTYFFGKRWYCSWVCGCGGLAETLGDPWRQLSSKSTRAWKVERWMIHSVLVFVTVTTALLWIDHASGQAIFGELSGALARAYGFWIGALFAGVIGVGFYPLLGSRVWCRFGCPMAAILGIVQRFFSRFRITTNGGQCMSCGNCSTYCEMGIDVRAYAEKGENIVRASCVGCGVCSAVCPRGVLKLENGPRFAERYPGSEAPFKAFAKALGEPTVP